MNNLRPHIKLNTREQKEDSVKVKFNYGFGAENNDKDKKEKKYERMIDSFRNSLTQYQRNRQIRVEERNEAIQVPVHIDYIQILFQDQFSIKDGDKNFYQNWYNDFGLLGVNFSKFNHEVLFAVIEREKFEGFLSSIQNFILKESNENSTVEYSGKVKYVKNFKLLTTSDIIKGRNDTSLMNFRLVDFPLDKGSATEIYKSLDTYLSEKGIEHKLSLESNNLEVFNISLVQIEEIAKNFDIVLSVTSSLSTVIRPSEFNIVERSYGFEITGVDENLPIIGILDTGISTETPLEPIVIKDESFNLTDSSPFVDSANAGRGHGTSVAALASMGRKPYMVDYRGEISVDAKLLSMKILDNNSGFLSQADVLDLLKKAKDKYPEIKLFVLTTTFSEHKKLNEDYSTYAYELDKFTHEQDCLIFICTANNNEASNCDGYNLNYFLEELTNLCTPAESMNNVIVGAAADNLHGELLQGISYGKEFPTLYTRKGHIDLTDLFPKKKQNKNLFRPDIIECGGDYEQSGLFIGTGEDASMELLSANPAFGFYKEVGTSFSTPLVANLAAQIQKEYPSLKAQTIKALIINGASLEAIRFGKPFEKLLNKTAGNGIVNPVRSRTSDDNTITFIIEDKIQPEEMKVIPLRFPEYLTTEDLKKSRGLLQITATLCFSFEPVLNNQLGYCPIHMAFAIFRNHSGEDINEKEDLIKSKLRLSWSQNGRYKTKPIPSSNTQKVHFTIGVNELREEDSTFKLAINCLINPQLLPGVEAKYIISHPFSLVITIKEDLPDAKLTGKLYSEMIAINIVENIAHVEGEADIDIELGH